jgi:ribosomal protein L32
MAKPMVRKKETGKERRNKERFGKKRRLIAFSYSDSISSLKETLCPHRSTMSSGFLYPRLPFAWAPPTEEVPISHTSTKLIWFEVRLPKYEKSASNNNT